MNFERAFKFIFEDEEWIKKIAIGGLLALTGIGNIAVMGWVAEIAKMVANKEEEKLPAWDNIGKFFMDGLKLWGISIIWMLPAIIAFSVVPIVMIALGESDMAGVSVFLSVCCYGFGGIYMIAVSLLLPPVYVKIAEGASFGELINPMNSWPLFKANIGGFLIAMIVGGLVTGLLSSLGTILCVIGAFATTVIGQAFMGHMLGQATGQARENMGSVPAVAVE